MTELSDASASTIAESQAVLERFLPRFNARFRVPAAEPAVAYRPLDRALPLASILGFRHPRSVARDNTVKYRWRTLQLLPGRERTSYAGAQVEVRERPGGELSVLHQGATIASREAPPRAGVLRAARSEGSTPAATMYSVIHHEYRRRDARGEPQRFVQHGRGLVGQQLRFAGIGLASADVAALAVAGD